MKTLTLSLAALLALSPAAAQAQVHIGIEIGLPVAPRLEVVSPGISVVAGFQEEVFLQNGWYWCRRDDGWYRARSPRSRFEWVEGRRVPRGLVRLPAGHYRNWHREGPERRMEHRGPEGRPMGRGAEGRGRGPEARGPEGRGRGPEARREGERRGEGERHGEGEGRHH